MKTRNNHKTALLAVQAAELAIAVPQVIAHRFVRMALSGTEPTKRDRKEFERMGTEKMAAFTESWNAMALQAWRAYQQITLAAFQSFWGPIFGLKKPTISVSNQLNNAVTGILGKGMAPFHRRAVANSKRLNKP